MDQSKNIPYDEWSYLAKLSEKFFKAMAELKRKSHINNGKKVATKINDYLKEHHSFVPKFDSSWVTNLSKIFQKNPKYENAGKEGILLHVLEYLDPRILNECGLEWDSSSRLYLKSKDIENISKYEALLGNYYGYTLDLEAPNTNLKEDKYWIHKFKIQIISRQKIKLFTKTTSFDSIEIRMIRDDKLFFKIVNEDNSRTVWFVVLLENRGPTELKKKPFFKSGYLDSGSTKIKSGRAILERTNAEDFEFCKSESLPRETLVESPISGYLEYLKSSQLIID